MKKETFKRLMAVFAIGIAYGSVYNPTYIRYLFYDAMLEAFQCTNTQLAGLNSFAVIVGIIAGMPGGWLADRFSAKKIVAISVMCNLPLCLISVLFQTVYPLQICVWFGFCLTGGFAFWPATLKAVRLAAPPDKQESTFGFFEACHGFSSMIGNFIAIWIFSLFVDQVAGYKAAMLSMGVFSFIGGVLILLLYKDGTITDDTANAKEVVKTPKAIVVKNTLTAMKNPGTWLVALVIIGAYGIYLAQSYFTSYFTGVLGAAVVFSAAMSNFRSYGMKMIGGPSGGFLASKFKSASKLNALCLIVCAGLVIYVWNLKPGAEGVVTLATVLTMVLAFFCLMAKGTMWATLEEAHIPREISGTAVAIITYVSFKTTEFGVPYLSGIWLDKYADNLSKAYDNIFTMILVMAAVGFAAAMALVIFDKNYRKKHPEEFASVTE